MVNLLEKSTHRYYFVKNGVVFDIKSSNPSGDACAKECGGTAGDENLDYIQVSAHTDTKESVTKYYLDVLIADGDTFVDDKFKHTVHSESGDSDGYYCVYFKELCLEEMAKQIATRKASYSFFKNNPSALNIPLWMLAKDDETNYYEIDASEEIVGFSQINFTEELYDELREKAVVALALDAANKKANEYGYKVNDKTLDLEKLPNTASKAV